MKRRRPRIWAGEGLRCMSTRIDGRFFAPLRMTCFALDVREVFRSHLRQTCHPEEAALSASGSSVGWLTKDLPRHRLMPERVLSFARDLAGGTFAPLPVPGRGWGRGLGAALTHTATRPTGFARAALSVS